ncbi:MAG: hypothetical protein U0892_13435 [Pirellulales bacterium]
MLYWESFEAAARHLSGKALVCGHTPQKSGLSLQTAGVLCIDTWAYGGGWLKCCHVESGRCRQANESGQIRGFWLDDLSIALARL